jgi:catalase
VLTTDQGTQVSDNQNSLRAGERGPTLLEDFVLLEKITHFDHERIPERVVHARGSAAHGYFEAYKPQQKLTRASFLAQAGKRTPLFARFSTVAGGAGSADCVRDVRGFAVKFYTDEGVFDLVGNNIPVFFIQDAIKFPDLIHAVKPEPNNAMPQAASAHDTFWDFVSLVPETTHTVMWAMSDRAIPRSYRMMQGFGVHTFRLVTAQGSSRFVKFHWKPKQGTYSLLWDEAVRLNGVDADFHRRDLWDAIEAGAFPEWELGLQVFDEAQAAQWGFDVLDPTKLVPEELAPIEYVGRMVLDRNPDNFFAETEQVAFHPGHLVPGIDFSDDPLLQGRIFSYTDTQLSRLGSPNFHELPINRSHAPVHNNQRDAHMRQTIVKGRVSYEPNSLGGGCPMQAGIKGFVTFPEPVQGTKVRVRAPSFADHFSQASLFWLSQSLVEREHIVSAFQFELTKVASPEIRERVVQQLANVDMELARRVGAALGIKPRSPSSEERQHHGTLPVPESPALSLFHLPSAVGIATRKVAMLVDEGTDWELVAATRKVLEKAGAVVKLVSSRVAPVKVGMDLIAVDGTYRTLPAVVFDACVLPAGDEATGMLSQDPDAAAFLREMFVHLKSMAVTTAGGKALAHVIGVAAEAAPGITTLNSPKSVAKFVADIANHRHWDRPLPRAVG